MTSLIPLMQFNTTKIRMEYSELRFNRHYILWYQNVAKLLITGIKKALTNILCVLGPEILFLMGCVKLCD